jgi:predicted ATPase
MRSDVLREPLTGLIGREAELAAIARFLAPDGGTGGSRASRTRLLTLVGPGGVGKTRLAIEATRRLHPRFADGACFVALAPVFGAERVPFAIAQALDLADAADRPVEQQLRDYLAGDEFLLVLDNFEHVLEAAPLIGDLLAAAPRLSVLVTSREGLRLGVEQQYPVPPLAVPCQQPLPPVETLAHASSVALFAQRARAVAPHFDLTPANAPSVAEIVCRLDGLPLAIELAAARVNVLPVREIARRLDQSLRLLTSGARDADPRHESMCAALDWSYGLLASPERTVLAQLAVFRGGFTLAAAGWGPPAYWRC